MRGLSTGPYLPLNDVVGDSDFFSLTLGVSIWPSRTHSATPYVKYWVDVFHVTMQKCYMV